LAKLNIFEMRGVSIVQSDNLGSTITTRMSRCDLDVGTQQANLGRDLGADSGGIVLAWAGAAKRHRHALT
jgi:hypothetical protein